MLDGTTEFPWNRAALFRCCYSPDRMLFHAVFPTLQLDRYDYAVVVLWGSVELCRGNILPMRVVPLREQLATWPTRNTTELDEILLYIGSHEVIP